MRLHCYRDWRGNFGDDLNESFFDAIAPAWRSELPHLTLIGIGTVLGERLSPIRNAVVFGSGFGQGAKKIEIDCDSTTILGVRGYRTAEALGIADDAKVIGDPALHIPMVPELLTGKSLSSAPIVVGLHHLSAEMWDFSNSNTDEIYFLDPGTTSIQDYIATIRQAQYLVCEAMHSAILAAAFRIPFNPVSISTPTDNAKWADFLESVGITHFDRTRVEPPAFRWRRKFFISKIRRMPRMAKVVSKKGAALNMREGAKVRQSIQSIITNGSLVRASNECLERLQQRRLAAIARLRKLTNDQTGGRN